MKLNALYVAANDFDRAVACYKDVVFQSEPMLETERFVFFDINGFLFSILNTKAAGETPTYGTNCVPTIEVEDADAGFERLTSANLNPVMPPQNIEGMRGTQVRDTESNLLEFYHHITVSR
ncbi:MAG: VOC family protein [Pseudomonadota bacterium]